MRSSLPQQRAGWSLSHAAMAFDGAVHGGNTAGGGARADRSRTPEQTTAVEPARPKMPWWGCSSISSASTAASVLVMLLMVALYRLPDFVIDPYVQPPTTTTWALPKTPWPGCAAHFGLLATFLGIAAAGFEVRCA